MIGSSTYDSHTDTVPLIPASVAINDIDSIAGVQVVDGAFSIDLPHLFFNSSEVRGLKDGDKEDKIKQVGLHCQACQACQACQGMQRAGFGSDLIQPMESKSIYFTDLG